MFKPTELFEVVPLGCLGWWGISGSFSMDSPGQLDVLGHDGDMPGMDGAEVSILKQSHEVCFGSLLEC